MMKSNSQTDNAHIVGKRKGNRFHQVYAIKAEISASLTHKVWSLSGPIQGGAGFAPLTSVHIQVTSLFVGDLIQTLPLLPS